MPNGFMGSRDEWDRLEAPLVALDRAFDEFAARHGCTLERNYHAWPCRIFRWQRDDGVKRSVAIALESEAASTFAVSGQAWVDASPEHWLTKTLAPVIRMPAPLDAGSVGEVLEDAHRQVDALTVEQLDRHEIADASFAAFLAAWWRRLRGLR